MAGLGDLTPGGAEDRNGGRVVWIVGMVPPGPSGVRDYGGLLAEELVRRGFHVDEAWVVSAGLRWRDAVACSRRFLRWATSVPAGVGVVWNYSSFAYGLRGVPLPGVLVGAVLRLRGVRVVTILHELAYPWGRRGWRGNVQAVTQWLAFQVVLMGSDVVVVTTEQRAEALRRRKHVSRPVYTAPVFSTIGTPRRVRWQARPVTDPVVGILNYTGDGARPDIVISAVAGLRRSCPPSLVLLGAPGPMHPDARRWQSLAEKLGVEGQVEFSGVLSRAELRTRIEACTVVVLPNDHGPSGRRTTLGTALAHGVPTVALDGPERWNELIAEEAALVVPADADAVTAALDDLLCSPDRQQELSRNGRAFYDRHMAVERLSGLIAMLLLQEPTH